MAATFHTNFRWGITGEPQQMLVEEGRVVARGRDLAELGAIADTVDHGDKLLIPAFIDNHCHILPAGLDLLALNLGGAETAEHVLDLLRDRHQANPEGWLLSVHYDHNRYGRHVTRAEIDAISSTRPIVLRHVSGHAGVVNSAAFQMANIDESVIDPEGGAFERDADGKLNGVLSEMALEQVMNAVPHPSHEMMVDAITAAGKSMHVWGICAAADMMTGRLGLLAELRAYRAVAEGDCRIATRLYVQWSRLFGSRAVSQSEIDEVRSGLDPARCRIAGVKIFADGAIGSSTAAVYGGYEADPVSEGEYTGTLIYKPERLKSMVKTAADAGWQVAVHSIGDHATDLVLDAFEATDDPSRHRLEHAMLLSDAQIERIHRIGCHVTFQPEFLIRFGKTYQKQLGQLRASKICRTRSVLDAGIPLSFSSDRPITSGDPWVGISTASKRPEGFDPCENCTKTEAIEAYTKTAALAMEDQDLMGNLSPGTRADFQLLDHDRL